MTQPISQPERCPGKGVGVNPAALAPCGSVDFHRPHEIAPPGTSAEELIAQAEARRAQVPALLAEHKAKAAAQRAEQAKAVEAFEAWRRSVDERLTALESRVTTTVEDRTIS
jgi:hypothetical protein